MCGIFGAIGDATDEALAAAQAALHHRGPDLARAWRDGADGLAHTRLKVIDLSEAASQPMAGCRPGVRVTFNGEIYNHRALQTELEARGHQFRSRSDTEAIVHGYEEWGDDVVARLDGMFAFGLWDAGRRRLLLARDRTGKKPLFYTVAADRQALRFASEVKALVAAGHPDALDPAALPMFLSWGYVPPPSTLHRGVRALPPASRLVFEPGRAPRVDEFWRAPFLDPPLTVDFSDARARVRELFIAAVERRLEADVPLGAFLSGGVDSTLVVGVMARILGRRVKTFSIGFSQNPAFDETPFAREASRAFGTEHTEFDLRPPTLDDIERLVWLHDGPFTDSAALPTWTVARLTREHVTVALSGDGGDELFAGYLRFLAAEASERVPQLVRTAARAFRRLLPGGRAPHSLGARARRFLDGAALPLGDRLARWNSPFADRLGDLFRPEVAADLDLDGPRAWQRSYFADGRGTTLARILDHNFRTYLANTLHTKLDRCSAGVGLEVRSPFLDTALVEYAARLPDGMKRRGTRTKHVLREAFVDLIPTRIARRPKRGFGVPLGEWFRGELRPLLLGTLGRGARVHDLLQSSKIAALIDEHTRGRADHTDQLWTLLTLELWLGSLHREASQPAARAATSR